MNFKLIGGFGIAEKELEKRIKQYKNKLKEKNLSNEEIKYLVIKDIIDKYFKVGIKEFFIGYNPPYWHEKYGFEFSPNGRFGENEQITSYDTFKKAIQYIHSKGAEIFLTVNFRYYTDDTMPLIQKIINESLECKIDGFIVGSPEILEYLATINYKGKINISTILSLYNQDAIEFILNYAKEKGLNINRVILPREVTLKEIKYLTSMFPDLKFEVFGHGDYCRYANGLCLAEHKYFSRDICGFVLKHGLEIKKTIRYDFKKIILDENLSNFEKQKLLDNSLDDIQYTFVSQTVVGSNFKNDLLEYYIDFFETEDNEETKKEIAEKLFNLLKKELTLNFYKFIWDGLRAPTDTHNLFIEQSLTLYNLIKPYIEDNKINKIEEKIKLIKKIKQKAKKYYFEEIQKKGKFGIETIYKFMLYNRTSIPFYKFFNEISNIEVVKIPLRGRDLTIFKLGLDIIKDAIKNPYKYINEGNISGKYFHYDAKEMIDKIIKNF